MTCIRSPTSMKPRVIARLSDLRIAERSSFGRWANGVCAIWRTAHSKRSRVVHEQAVLEFLALVPQGNACGSLDGQPGVHQRSGGFHPDDIAAFVLAKHPTKHADARRWSHAGRYMEYDSRSRNRKHVSREGRSR